MYRWYCGAMLVRMDKLARHYRDGCAAGELRLQRCSACRARQFFARPFCVACGAGDVAWEVARGTGTVYAVTRVERAPSDEFRALAPYTIVLVDLDEGVRMMAHGAHGLCIGDRVAVRFFVHDGGALPRFVPHDGSEPARR
jgi:uncharacterized OB-fold protein